MTREFVIGMTILFLAGLSNGSFAWPMKYARHWKWENTWLLFTFLALFVLPLLLTLEFVPQVGELYSTAPLKELLPALIFGFLWGIAQTTFGIGIAAVGMALAIAVVVGLTGSLGSLIPMLVLHPGELHSARGIALLVSLPILILGLVLYGVAGRRREKEQPPPAADSLAPKMSFAVGLAICIFTGVFGSMLNLGFAFSGALQHRSESLGANPVFATYAVWMVVLTAGFIPNLTYCSYLLLRNHTWPLYSAHGRLREAALCLAMAALWLGGVFGYGMGSRFLKGSGTSFGFAVVICATVLISNLLGLFMGEWEGTTRRTRHLLAGAVATVLLSLIVLALGGIF